MTDYREILRQHSLGVSQRGIASSLGVSRNTVSKVLKRSQELALTWPLSQDITNHELDSRIRNTKTVLEERANVDFEWVHKEYLKQHVTLKLLWMEYCDQARSNKETPLMYSQFCHLYREYTHKKRAVMHISRKPGELIEVDWAGKTVSIFDRDTGEVYEASLFVAVLPYSQYTFVWATPTKSLENWIEAHVKMYQYFGGSSKILVPDNLKTGVQAIKDYEVILNKTYQEMAEHYSTVIIPTRVRKPQDKASVERAVKQVSSGIVASLRNYKFFSMSDLNHELTKRLKLMNTKPFHKKEGSRLSVFLEEEKHFLTPHPKASYELAQWKVATVQFNYHIQVEKMHYSVPYEYIKQQVNVRLTKNVIEIFYKNNRVASHARLYGRLGQYSTIEIHMPADHQKYIQWDKKRFIDWAEKIGVSTKIVTESIINAYRIEQQAYRSCMGLLKLADTYSTARLENACKIALSITNRPSLKSVKNILQANRDKVDAESPKITKENPYGFTRGANYYGGKTK